jgi:hypothetical protein
LEVNGNDEIDAANTVEDLDARLQAHARHQESQTADQAFTKTILAGVAARIVESQASVAQTATTILIWKGSEP